MTYMEYLKIILPKHSIRIINQTMWCGLFNNGECDKRFPNLENRSCIDYYYDQMRPDDGVNVENLLRYLTNQ